MTVFSYVFGLAIGFTLVFIIANQWIRDNRGGRWTARTVVALAVTALVIGLIIGWGLADFLSFTELSATHKMPMD